jgi:rhodanese-related sulfurtransferase
MEQIIEFSSNHLLLVAAFFVVAALLIYTSIVGSKGEVDPTTATELINHQNAIVVDVRPMADFSKGHIINSKNIPLNSLKKQMNELDKFKDTPVIVSCRSGNQSRMGCRHLKQAGFQQVYNLSGGIMNWQNANLPLTSK